MTLVTPSRNAGRRRGSHARPGRLRGLWEASPLTYVTLFVALVLSVFPIYWMIVVATRTNTVVSDVPPPLLPGGNIGDNVGRLFDTSDAYFAKGLLNSAIVSSVNRLPSRNRAASSAASGREATAPSTIRASETVALASRRTPAATDSTGKSNDPRRRSLR